MVRRFFSSDSDNNTGGDGTNFKSVRKPEKREVAGYIAELSAEMEQMAEAAKLDVLSYLLAMARQEARKSAK